jgi:hypothetical protein
MPVSKWNPNKDSSDILMNRDVAERAIYSVEFRSAVPAAMPE